MSADSMARGWASMETRDALKHRRRNQLTARVVPHDDGRHDLHRRYGYEQLEVVVLFGGECMRAFNEALYDDRRLNGFRAAGASQVRRTRARGYPRRTVGSGRCTSTSKIS